MDGELYKLFEGTQFNHKYYLKTFLGAGVYGAVFLADEVLGDTVIQTVALKAIRTDRMNGVKILQELQTAIKLRHQNLLHCITAEIGKLQQHTFNIDCYGLVMEVASGNLEEYLNDKKSLSSAETHTILRSLADGLAYLHREKITHRDLKPANLLQVGNTWKISDFGIAREMGSQTGTMTQSISGTPNYMPPEAYKAQVQKTAVKVAPSWDMWAYGVMAAQLLTGELPFDGLGDILQGQVKPKKLLAAPFDAIVKSCLSQDPALRMTAPQVLARLQGGSTNIRIETPRQPQPPPSPTSIGHYGFLESLFNETPKQTEPRPSNFNEIDLGNDIKLELVSISAGSFLMGSADAGIGREERPQHRVNVSVFMMGKYPVTQEQYEAVMGKNPSYFKGRDHPVERVSWHDAKAFCAKLTKKTGRVVRLPSEAEWEYACRAGSTSAYYFGNDAERLGEYAWNQDNSYYHTHPVGQKKANIWGLFDMHGNVWEWCEDQWRKNNGAPTNDRAVTSRSDSSEKLLRGGCWNSYANYCRAAYCFRYDADFRLNCIGFRIVCALQ